MGGVFKGGQLGSYWKYRIGDYRVIACIEDSDMRIIIVRAEDRKDG